MIAAETEAQRLQALANAEGAQRRLYEDWRAQILHARAMIEEGQGPWAARNCVCRQGQDLLGEPCKQTTARRVCLTIGGAARATVASGDGQELNREETLALLDQAEREGMVLQPANAQDPLFMCFCCGCCCGMLRAAKQFPKPAEYLQSNYRAVVDAGFDAKGLRVL